MTPSVKDIRKRSCRSFTSHVCTFDTWLLSLHPTCVSSTRKIYIYTPYDDNSKLVVSLYFIHFTYTKHDRLFVYLRSVLQRYLSLYKRYCKREYTGIGKIELSLPLYKLRKIHPFKEKFLARFDVSSKTAQRVKCSIRFEDLLVENERWFIEKVIELVKSLFGGPFRKGFEGVCRATMTLSTFEKNFVARKSPMRPCPRFLERIVIEAQREFYDLIFHRSRHAIVLFVIPRSGWQLAKREMHEITRHPFILSLSLSLRPYRWKMFYDQTLRSPFKQHIANATTAESSNDRTWQNIVAKPSSCICFPHHFCLCNWFIAIVAWKLGRAKCFTTVFLAKPPRTKLGRL